MLYKVKKSVFIYTLILIMLFLLTSCAKYWQNFKQPEPTVQYNEFPFRLTYELEGEVFVVEDSVICEYAGQEFNEGTGKMQRKWKARLKSEKTRITLLNTDDGIEIFYLNLLTFPSGVYMGETNKHGNIAGTFPDALYTTNFESPNGRYIISDSEMWEKYNLRLIDWEIAPPIKNSFE